MHTTFLTPTPVSQRLGNFAHQAACEPPQQRRRAAQMFPESVQHRRRSPRLQGTGLTSPRPSARPAKKVSVGRLSGHRFRLRHPEVEHVLDAMSVPVKKFCARTCSKLAALAASLTACSARLRCCKRFLLAEKHFSSSLAWHWIARSRA